MKKENLFENLVIFLFSGVCWSPAGYGQQWDDFHQMIFLNWNREQTDEIKVKLELSGAACEERTLLMPLKMYS